MTPTGSTGTSGPDLSELVEALRQVATALRADQESETENARLLRELLRTGGRSGLMVPPPSDAQIRTTRDFEVLLALLGRAGAAPTLAMSREADKKISVPDGIPNAAVLVLVQAAPFEGEPAGVTEEIHLDELVGGLSVRRHSALIELSDVPDFADVIRVQLLDRDGKLVGVGPSLPAVSR